MRADERAADKQARLRHYASEAMGAHGLLSSFDDGVMDELASIKGPAQIPQNASVKDLRDLPWCSIDNAASRDLDQLTVAIPEAGDSAKIIVALADVDALVPKASKIDLRAGRNTCSVYTPAQIFPMIPERLSTYLSSLNFNEDRLAIAIEFEVDANGIGEVSSVSRALVRNKAKLAYDSVGRWLEGQGPMPFAIGEVEGLQGNIVHQARVAQLLKKLRHENGALDLESPEPKPALEDGELRYHGAERGNKAKLLIEDFMIAANGTGARTLAAKSFPSIRRIVRTPKRWTRIVELARERGCRLPDEPDSKALEAYLLAAKELGQATFHEISFNVMKLLGPGEYAVAAPGQLPPGHFGLAVKDYAHSTAPNRRYADLVTHRLFKAAIDSRPCPYSIEELETIARRCTLMEDAAKKVERQLNKSAVAMILEDRIGDEFNAIVTGCSEKGTWVRIDNPPVEGRLSFGQEGLDVGDKLRVRLVHTNAALGHIDFKRTRS